MDCHENAASTPREAQITAIRCRVRVRLWRMRWAALVLGLGYVGAAIALDRYGAREVQGRFDAIVVAGCRVMPDGRPSPALARRVEHAAALWHDGVAPLLVLTGGVGDNPPSEAEVAASHARALGVPEAALVRETGSTSTDENARLAAQLIGNEARIVVVSDRYHVFRCERVFGQYFEQVMGTGSKGQPWPRLRGSLREVAVVAIYGALGRL